MTHKLLQLGQDVQNRRCAVGGSTTGSWVELSRVVSLCTSLRRNSTRRRYKRGLTYVHWTDERERAVPSCAQVTWCRYEWAHADVTVPRVEHRRQMSQRCQHPAHRGVAWTATRKPWTRVLICREDLSQAYLCIHCTYTHTAVSIHLSTTRGVRLAKNDFGSVFNSVLQITTVFGTVSVLQN